jgi:hypothetical protein
MDRIDFQDINIKKYNQELTLVITSRMYQT